MSLWGHKLQISRELGGILRLRRVVNRGSNRKSEKQLLNTTRTARSRVGAFFVEEIGRRRVRYMGD